MAEEAHHDGIVVGSGAGGGTLAHRLAPAGKKVLILERGVREGQVPAAGVLARSAARRIPAGGQPLRRRQHQVLRGGPVPAASYDFGEIRHHDGLSPAWPIGYEDLEPYYTQAEHLYQIHGTDLTAPPRAPHRQGRSRPTPCTAQHEWSDGTDGN